MMVDIVAGEVFFPDADACAAWLAAVVDPGAFAGETWADAMAQAVTDGLLDGPHAPGTARDLLAAAARDGELTVEPSRVELRASFPDLVDEHLQDVQAIAASFAAAAAYRGTGVLYLLGCAAPYAAGDFSYALEIDPGDTAELDISDDAAMELRERLETPDAFVRVPIDQVWRRHDGTAQATRLGLRLLSEEESDRITDRSPEPIMKTDRAGKRAIDAAEELGIIAALAAVVHAGRIAIVVDVDGCGWILGLDGARPALLHDRSSPLPDVDLIHVVADRMYFSLNGRYRLAELTGVF